MDIELLYSLYKKSFLVDTDTRNIRKDSIFFGLRGENFDGNKFAKVALDRGAQLCILDNPEYLINDQTILVDNALSCLQSLARYHRKQLSIPIIGLTGSNGKTTSKELMHRVLSKKYSTYATHGNLNNHIGVPLSILSVNPEHEIGIIEMGANHQKEIEFLSSISNPDFGFITNFGKAHMEGFGGVEGIVKGKSELYQNIRLNNKKVFVNEEDVKQMELTSDLDRILFQPSEVKILSENPFLKLEFKERSFQTNLIGSYNTLNIAIALRVGGYFEVPIQNCLDAIVEYIPTNNRSQYIKKVSNSVYLDAYNANPSSMELALKSFSNIESDRKVVILGDMFELGEDSQKEHQSINDICEKLHLDQVFLVGEHFSKAKSNYTQFTNYSSFENYFKELDIVKSAILIKGSRGMALERIVKHIS